VVEYALRLPGGKYLPIDSKWTSVGVLERLEAVDLPQERKRLVDQVVRDVRGRIKEMTKYLDPERTLSLGLLAVPDAVYTAAPEAHADGYREGILVVPYSLALPYVLALYRLTLRFGCAVDTDQLADRLRALNECVRKLDEEVEGRLSRGIVQLENSREALRDHLGEARRSTDRLLQTTDERLASDPQSLPAAVGQRD
jgi:DNA recombination protein RmuC